MGEEGSASVSKGQQGIAWVRKGQQCQQGSTGDSMGGEGSASVSKGQQGIAWVGRVSKYQQGIARVRKGQQRLAIQQGANSSTKVSKPAVVSMSVEVIRSHQISRR
jgi:hypothetical protein